MNKKITLIEGDGIGLEITQSVLKIFEAAKVKLDYDQAVVGEKIYYKGASSGIDEDAWKIIRRNDVMLKAPITTPTGSGYKSLNVTIRKELGLYINLRPSISYYPVIQKSPQIMDMVIVRENEEDLYAGIEHRQTPGSYSSLKLLTRAGSIKICHFAFEYAKAHGRKKVTCMVKDNIMKMADGMFFKAFQEVGKHYPEIQQEHYIIDIGSARIAAKPEIFDVIVTENLYGDIISDIASEVCGSVGIAGSANLGDKYAMFEAIHGSAPRMAGQNTANPTAFINASVMMLRHIDMNNEANLIENALLATIDEGYHTKDLFVEGISKQKMSTTDFTNAVIDHLGSKPTRLKAKEISAQTSQETFNPEKYSNFLNESSSKGEKKLVGVDLFLDWKGSYGSELAKLLNSSLSGFKIQLSSILSRGLNIWSANSTKQNEKKIELCDHWMCRFLDNKISHDDVFKIIEILTNGGFDVIKMEKLYNYVLKDGSEERGYSMGQGE
jgi:isocitrate dehydrogenase